MGPWLGPGRRSRKARTSIAIGAAVIRPPVIVLLTPIVPLPVVPPPAVAAIQTPAVPLHVGWPGWLPLVVRSRPHVSCCQRIA